MKAIEHPHRHSGQAEKENVRKHDPVQIRSQFELPRRCRESRGEHSNEEWRKYDAQDCHNRHDDGGERQQGVCEFPGFFATALREVLRKHRNEGGVCSTFAHDSSKKIWNPVGDRERICGIGSSQKVGHTRISEVTENSTKNGESADGTGGPEQLSVFAHSTR